MTDSTRRDGEAGPILNIGIIGAGGRGVHNYGKLIGAREDARVVAYADPNLVRMAAAAQILGADFHTYPSAEALLAQEKLDGLIITSPDRFHADQVVAGLQAGIRHILVEKPLATTADGCSRIVEALREFPAHIAIGFNMRHLPLICAIKQLIEDGAIGRLMMIENREFYDGGRTYMARWNRRSEWSGGLWVHKGSHDFDVFNWWNSAGTPVRVSAAGGLNALRPEGIPFEVEAGRPVGPNCTACSYSSICPDYSPPMAGTALYNPETAAVDGYLQDLCIYLSDKDTHDNGIAVVEYDNNVRASHMECFICNFTDRFYTVIGDRGVLMAHLEDPTHIEFRPRWGENRVIEVPAAVEGSHGGADPLLVDSFLAGIRSNRSHSSGVRDGVRAVAVGHAAEVSWREGRKVSISELIDLSQIASDGPS